jgi:hypothetical protein
MYIVGSRRADVCMGFSGWVCKQLMRVQGRLGTAAVHAATISTRTKVAGATAAAQHAELLVLRSGVAQSRMY